MLGCTKLLREILASVRRIEARLIIEGETTMSAFEDLQAQVAQNTSIEESAVTLIKGLKAQLDAAGTDPAKLADLSAKLGASASDLGAAVVANTPAAPAPTQPAA